MTQAADPKRIVSGVEMFFGESVAQYLADVSDESYYDESVAEGLLLGKVFVDDQGRYVVISGATQDLGRTESAVGWFRCSPCADEVSENDLRRIRSVLGDSGAYMILANSQQGTLSMYSVDHVVRKVRSIMIENF
ncbi:MAG: hypothetical protein MJZ38_05950 [archaeon]|nr:hypothetical protein [archaeon]